MALRLIALPSKYAADSVAPVNPRIIPPSGMPIKNSPKLTAGPAIAMCPFCLRVTNPATITAPGAMNKNPVNATRAIPNFRPLGSTLNSAQHPYFLATIL